MQDDLLDDVLDEDLQDQDEQALYEHFNLVVDKGQSMLRIDKFLMDRIQNSTRNKIQHAARIGNIKVNGKPVKPNYKVKPLDEIGIFLTYPPREVDIIPENIPVNIFYEDDDLLIVNKTPNMVVHPGFGNFKGTLLNALAYYMQNVSPTKQPDAVPHMVHRIDKDTSGLLLLTKNDTAQTMLAEQFYNHTIERKYKALVWGDFKEDEGTVEGNIGRSLKDRKIMTVFPDGDYGKTAVTHYKVVERFGYVTLVECQLETGRTHQIRAHMRYIKHPLFNDATYGGNQILKGTTFSKYKQFIQNCFQLLPRQALHAQTLGFIHPTTGEKMFFESELPADMTAALEKWRGYVKFNELEEEPEEETSSKKNSTEII